MRYNSTICLLLFILILAQNSVLGQCEIISVGLSNVYCNDNATPLDTLDDFIIFTVQPTGNNVSNNYTIDVSSGNLNSNSGQFGVPKVFFLQQGSAGGGNISLIIQDMVDTLCFADTILIDPGICSSLCNITDLNFEDLECHDNGTNSNPYDDFLSFKIAPSGSNVDNTFFVEVSKGSVNPIFGNYGVQSTHTMQPGSAGNGDFNLTISDDADINCYIDSLIIDPGSCSPLCELLLINLDSISCNNNSTPAIPEDDFVTFSLNPEGFNLSGYYTLEVSEGTVFPDSAAYGEVSSFQLSIGSAELGDITLSISDSVSSTCSLDTIINNPGTCSPDCMIFESGLSSVMCNNNNTDSTGVDDYISFDLNPVGSSNNGNFYIISVSSGTVAPTIGAFGQTTSFVMQYGSAGGGNVDLTIKDMSNNACQITTVIQDPGPCSTLCDILDPQFSNLVCNDNGTDDNPTDDFLEFSLNPTGIELSTNYLVSIDSGSITPESGYYDSLSYFMLSPGSAVYESLELLLVDSIMTSCFYNYTINSPGSCSPECNILDAQLDSLFCNNNGTPSDNSDDRIEFLMTPYGYNLNKNYTVIVSSGTIMPTMGSFENQQLFQLQDGSAGNGDVVVKIKDIFDQTCPLDVTINDPGTCSPDCEIIEVLLDNVECNSNNTLSDYTDDFISFSLSPAGFNVDDNYILEVSQGVVEPSTGLFGETTNFSLQLGSAGSGDVNLTIYSATDSLCFEQVIIIDPGSCSPNCSIADLQMADLMCNDNETAHDTLDDYLSFTLTPIGFNISSNYAIEISDGTISPNMGEYNQSTTFELSVGSAGSGDKVITLTDMEDPDCITQMLVSDPGHCSDVCLITENNLTEIECDNNNTTTDDSDDFIRFSLKPLGGNVSENYNLLNDTQEVSPNTGLFGEKMNFSLNAGSAGNGNTIMTIQDMVDTSCTFVFELIDPGTCSPECEINDIGLENIFCNDNNTESDASDDFISIQINPSAFNAGDTYNLDISSGSIDPDTGAFNVLKTFNLNLGSAGAGNLQLTLSSSIDSFCSENLFIEDPGTCSPQCEIIDVIANSIVCNDNNTSANSDDDYLSFTLAIEGFNLGGQFLLSSSIGQITPNKVLFNTPQNFVLSAGSAGSGDIEISITNMNDASCKFTKIITDPGSCSTDCLINNTMVQNLHCEDNDTSDDPTDDFVSFDINPKGFNVSDSFYLSTLNWSVSPNSGEYGVSNTYSLSAGSAGAGLNLLRIVDSKDTSCFKNVLLTNPGTCSEDCNMISAQLSEVLCNDNTTPTDSLDDFISFKLNPVGFNLNGSYLLFAMNGIVNPTTANYNEETIFNLQSGSAGMGNVSLLIIDENDTDCEIMINIEDPGSCSDLSSIKEHSGIWDIKCYPNPVSSSLFLNGLPKSSRIEIRNLIGKLVYVQNNSPLETNIDLSAWASGMYILSIFQGREQIFTEKLIKE